VFAAAVGNLTSQELVFASPRASKRREEARARRASARARRAAGLVSSRLVVVVVVVVVVLIHKPVWVKRFRLAAQKNKSKSTRKIEEIR
jgi:hypothetical protein